MGGVKRQMMEMEDLNNRLKGSDSLVAFSGGFLDVQIDGHTICTVSIPIPNFMADKYRDSVSEWYEEFHDDDENNYNATVYSSMYGVEWDMELASDANGLEIPIDKYENILSKITIDIHYTEDT